MTLTHHAAVLRIDRERRGLHAAVRGRLQRADRRGDDLAASVRRLALIARLRGLKRAALDATAATRRDVRVAHLELARADEDDDRERDTIAWLIAWLGLGAAAVALMQDEAEEVAGTAGGELERVRAKAAAAKSTTVVDLRPATPRSSVQSPPSVFGTFGRANLRLPPATLDTWAETLAYTQYERGRWDARNVFPAYSEMLYGYRWSSVLDARTTLGCKLLDGWVAPLEDTRMSALRPPRHWGCRAVLVEVWQSSRLRMPVPMNAPNDATFGRLLDEKERFIRRVA